MKNRIIALLVVMVVAVMSFASCGLFPGKGGGGGGGTQGGGDDVVDADYTVVDEQ